jgi:ABC-type sulfate transport system substrate-binding protein
MAIAYEADAIRAVQGGASDLRIVYPSPTAVIVLPAAVVEGSWVSEKQRQLSGEFVDYLRQDEVQTQAIENGYRPMVESAHGQLVQAIANPVLKGAGLAEAPRTSEGDLSTQTKEGLIYNWDQWHKATNP